VNSAKVAFLDIVIEGKISQNAFLLFKAEKGEFRNISVRNANVGNLINAYDTIVDGHNFEVKNSEIRSVMVSYNPGLEPTDVLKIDNLHVFDSFLKQTILNLEVSAAQLTQSSIRDVIATGELYKGLINLSDNSRVNINDVRFSNVTFANPGNLLYSIESSKIELKSSRFD
jgi:hypothetical protein